jgi:geranylgeranyl diphosphate synthase type II
LGKNVGSDTRQEKITFPAVVGLKRSKEIQKELVDRAIESLAPFDQRAEPLIHIAKYIIARRT